MRYRQSESVISRQNGIVVIGTYMGKSFYAVVGYHRKAGGIKTFITVAYEFKRSTAFHIYLYS